MYSDYVNKLTKHEPHYVSKLTLIAWHRPSMVYEVTEALAHLEVDVISSSSSGQQAPHCGGHLICISLEVLAPKMNMCERLEKALTSLGDDVMVDWHTADCEDHRSPMSVPNTTGWMAWLMSCRAKSAPADLSMRS